MIRSRGFDCCGNRIGDALLSRKESGSNFYIAADRGLVKVKQVVDPGEVKGLSVGKLSGLPCGEDVVQGGEVCGRQDLPSFARGESFSGLSPWLRSAYR